MEMTEKRSYAFASAKTEPAPAQVYVTVTGHPPRDDQPEFKEFLNTKLERNYIPFRIKGLDFEVCYTDIEKGFIPPRPNDGLVIRMTNGIRRYIRHSRYVPGFIKKFAKHKVPTGFAMAKVNVLPTNDREKAGAWLEYFANTRDIFPEEIPMKSFKILVSPQDLYLKVQEFYNRPRS